MPKPLPFTTVPVKWRVEPETLDLLRAVHGEGNVNEVVRAVLGAYCDRLRIKLRGAGSIPKVD